MCYAAESAVGGLKARVAVKMLYIHLNTWTSVDVETTLHHQDFGDFYFFKQKRDFVTIQNINTCCFEMQLCISIEPLQGFVALKQCKEKILFVTTPYSRRCVVKATFSIFIIAWLDASQTMIIKAVFNHHSTRGLYHELTLINYIWNLSLTLLHLSKWHHLTNNFSDFYGFRQVKSSIQMFSHLFITFWEPPNLTCSGFVKPHGMVIYCSPINSEPPSSCQKTSVLLMAKDCLLTH